LQDEQLLNKIMQTVYSGGQSEEDANDPALANVSRWGILYCCGRHQHDLCPGLTCPGIGKSEHKADVPSLRMSVSLLRGNRSSLARRKIKQVGWKTPGNCLLFCAALLAQLLVRPLSFSMQHDGAW